MDTVFVVAFLILFGQDDFSFVVMDHDYQMIHIICFSDVVAVWCLGTNSSWLDKDCSHG